MDSFLACHNVFLGNKWAVSAARGNRNDAVTASSGAAVELLAVKLPEITLAQHFFPAVVHSLYIFLFLLYLFPAGAMKQQNNFFAGLCVLFYIQFIPSGFSQSRHGLHYFLEKCRGKFCRYSYDIHNRCKTCLVSANWLAAQSKKKTGT